MGRPRTPKKVLEMSGAFKKDPQRALERAGEAEGVGDIGGPPPHFLKPSSVMPQGAGPTRLAELWEEFKAQIPAGVVTGSDRALLESLCLLTLDLERARNSRERDRLIKSRLLLLKELGLTPRARAQLDVGSNPDGAEDELEKFRQRRRKVG